MAPYAIEYGRIIFLGAIFSTGFSTIVRADGSIRFSTAMWIIPVAANTLLVPVDSGSVDRAAFNGAQDYRRRAGALRLMALACPLGGISVMVAAYFQAVGRLREALVLTLGGILLVKLPVLLLSSSLFSLMGIWISEAISEGILGVIALLMLRGYQRTFL